MTKYNITKREKKIMEKRGIGIHVNDLPKCIKENLIHMDREKVYMGENYLISALKAGVKDFSYLELSRTLERITGEFWVINELPGPEGEVVCYPLSLDEYETEIELAAYNGYR